MLRSHVRPRTFRPALRWMLLALVAWIALACGATRVSSASRSNERPPMGSPFELV
ncbi:hypothetical protein [Sandaracinus amylolyticus]|uniref:Uncharacterized protein n=1 Tax=Sandaracinus amylolyticus TaxID=927083 RepID=A0A0F6VYU2_9BACT|nr:hypothetical protein [Sandaracinus amylolyticus]AKF03125.1 hypothetical protein DB32_000274 [Sandaracinus amylolyticus]